MKFEQSFVEPQRGFARGTLGQCHGPKTITLGFLAKDVPASAISEELAKSLAAETGASVVLLRLQSSAPGSLPTSANDQATVVDWAPCESVLQGQFRPGALGRTESGWARFPCHERKDESSRVEVTPFRLFVVVVQQLPVDASDQKYPRHATSQTSSH